jgi:hypothetical protein
LPRRYIAGSRGTLRVKGTVIVAGDARALIKFHEGQHEKLKKFNTPRKIMSPNMVSNIEHRHMMHQIE